MRRSLFAQLVVCGLIGAHVKKILQGKAPRRSLVSYLTHLTNKNLLGVVVGDVIAFLLLSAVYRVVRRICASPMKANCEALADWSYSVLRSLPFIKGSVEAEMEKHERDLASSVLPKGIEYLPQLPESGMSREEIIGVMKAFVEKEKGKWEEGRLSGGVYHGGEEHIDLMNVASSLYAISNPLHIDIWPSLHKFESDIIKMTANIVCGTCDTVCGSMTSGGTESIILAIRAHKAAGEARGITNPELIACVTAHAAVNKACEMLGIHLITVPFDPETFEMDVNATRRAISSDTIMIYSSAPNYPSGIVDPIEKLSKLAKKYSVGLHVDCCLGGFILPFGKEAGFDVPSFDFSNPGVTSMSVDTHKYGYAAKGSSVVLYRNKELRRHQYFTYPKWTGGLYATTTIAGSRPGSIIAATWASMTHMGRKGYVQAAKEILQTAQEIKEGLHTIPELRVLGNPQVMVVAFAAKNLNIYQINDAMTHRGWSLNALQNPASAHLCVTLRHIGQQDKFLSDLKEAVKEVKEKVGGNGEAQSSGSAPIYGTVGGLPAGPVKDVMCRYLDVTLS